HIASGNEIYNLILERSIRDLASLTTFYDSGPYLAAGIPWFTAPFGRDGIIAALQTLIMGPDLAIGTLRYLARQQAHDDNPFRDEEPGKIMHERRVGELANLQLIPHTPYYGSVDSTPLFLILLSETFRWTGDLGLVRELWDAVEAALMWIEGYGDMDGDGFVEYSRRSPMGLFSQGWKDSHNSVLHPDATVAEPPIALAEVQGYVYDAKCRMAELCYLLDLRILGDRLQREADELKTNFDQAFWDNELNFYVEALDGRKRPVRTKTSNPGHCLWSGIVPVARARIMAQGLLADDMFNGWGIRTVSAASPVYNPLSYHNGTIWPHDNAIIAKGLANYGFKREAIKLMDALYHAALHFDYYRLPELFCGLVRGGELDRPVPYPVACSPQAWAAGTTLLLLQAALGLVPNAKAGILHIIEPMLPPWLTEVNLQGLRIGDSSLDLQFIQVSGITTARVLKKEGKAKIVIEG
ncbi:MAG: amylo-alpha-1,6-glucosidase, partial [Cyanobacteria bacterium NC_groundwater_1444_Ag_S-0.65um_54_12]|nr:amylo-alpha-1,6-glucosidase [Cyanobacteria bacterium NC_groundwater_1444_Ag_S-0.65um_54_12]